MKVAIIIGHNEQQPGAMAIAPINEPEFIFNTEVARLMLEYNSNSEIELKTFNRIQNASVSSEIKKVYQEVDQWDADYSIELHFNSFNDSVAGSETLSSGSQKSKKFASYCQEELIALYGRSGTSDRGIKICNKKGQRGYLSLFSGKAPAILPEPFFGSNPEECQKQDHISHEGLAKAYLRSIAKLLH